ncbi:histone H1 [Nitrosospira sp. Nsp18]|uniref:histone H1 n=1 Tax=Nitrosospira sp. Nsp18 TaxID=1855334 RepID=UPI000B812EAB|nr:histone H1 [Nitrosospira sp. Nsp18]
MKSKTNPRKDFTQIAFDVVRNATGEAEPQEPIDEKKKAAQESGRRGGLKGGKARASKLTPKQREQIARTAAQARWKKT